CSEKVNIKTRQNICCIIKEGIMDDKTQTARQGVKATAFSDPKAPDPPPKEEGFSASFSDPKAPDPPPKEEGFVAKG
ncbi:MAG: hypothetical protein V3T83_05155, partial [Acidobacteriota bacterium]